jgi:hypothetical protein
MQMIQEPEILRGYENARRKVVETLSNLNFARVVSIIQMPPKVGKDPIFQGEVEEVFCGKNSRVMARHAFFSKFLRNTMGVNVLGCFTLVDSAMGPDHSSSIPNVGDILVGSFVNATQRGKLPYEFKGWCNNGKPLLELLRILQFGSRMSKGELHMLLRQPASVTANFALRLQEKFLKPHERSEALKSSLAQDDIWVLARALCFRELEKDDKLKLSRPHFDILTQLAMITLDETLLDDLQGIMPIREPEPIVKESDFSGMYGAYGTYSAYGQKSEVQSKEQTAEQSVGDEGRKTPPWQVKESGTPKFMPSSPTYMPSSPPYHPESPEPEKEFESLPPPQIPSQPQSALSKLLGTIDRKTLQNARLVNYSDV